MEQGFSEKAEKLALSCLKLFQIRLEDAQTTVVKKTLLFLSLSVLATVSLLLLAFSVVNFAQVEFGVSPYVSGLVASALFAGLWAFLFIRKTGTAQKSEQKEQRTQIVIDENIQSIKEQAQEILSPVNFIKNNAPQVAVGTFVASFLITLLTNKNKD